MNKGIIRRLGDETVDVQLAGSAATLPGVLLSGQIDASTLVVGTSVLVDVVNGQHVVLHTLTEAARNPVAAAQSATSRVLNNALLADGSVPLTGNLPVAPGVTIDGYDISVLGQAISNLQGADTIARTGWTAFSHSTHLVSTITASATEILVRDAIFELYEQIALSNINGEVEFMRIDSAATQTVDDRGAICYRYTVTRRMATSPGGLSTGWAASSLVNGLTKRGFITIDNRHRNSINSPNIGGAIWVNNPPTIQERVFRFGGLNGVLGITTNDFGVAIGNLDTRNTYLLFNASREQLELKNVDYKVVDSSSEQVVRIYGKNENDRLAGDYDFGNLGQVHNSFYGEHATWGVYRATQPIIEIGEERSHLRDLFTIGNPIGARIDLGELDDTAVFALRDKFGVAKLVARTDDTNNVYVHIGNPPPQHNSMSFDSNTGKVRVDGNFALDQAEIYGKLTIVGSGTLEFVDENDPLRKGVINRRGIAGYSVDALGQQYLSSVDAWGPLVLENRPGSGNWKTWLAGEMMRGDPDYRNFRVTRGPSGKVGLFNGDEPVVYLDANGSGFFTGLIYARGGEFTGDVRITKTGALLFGGDNVLDGEGIKLLAGAGVGQKFENSVSWIDRNNKGVVIARMVADQAAGDNTFYVLLNKQTAAGDVFPELYVSSSGSDALGARATLQAVGDTKIAKIVALVGPASASTIDLIADSVLVNGAPIGGADAADVTYTPAVAADWDGSADPGNVDDALDQLAERVTDVEGAGHDAVTLAADADTLLGLTGQELTLDTQTANRVFAGPTSGAAADPTFRAVVAADLGSGTGSSSNFLRGDMAWSVPSVVKTLVFFVSGTLTVASASIRLHVPEAMTITNVTAAVNTAPTGASLIVDVNKNGTTIFSTQGNRPTIAATETEDTSSTPDVTALAQNDVVTIDVDQIGSTVAGADLVVQVRCTVP